MDYDPLGNCVVNLPDGRRYRFIVDSITIEDNIFSLTKKATAVGRAYPSLPGLAGWEQVMGTDFFAPASRRDIQNENKYAVSRILKSGPYTHVFWADGTKSSVRRSPDEEDNDYAAFTAALAIKMYGSNSALKRMLKEKVEVQKPKEKKSSECTDTCPIDFEAIERNLKAKNDAT